MTATTVPVGQEKTGWKWEQWLNKAGEFYRNVVCLWGLCQGGDNFIPKSNQGQWTTCPTCNPYVMDVDKISLSLADRAEHIWKRLCFTCHKPRCHSLKHARYLGKERDPQNWCNWNPPPGLQAGVQAWEVSTSQVENYIKKWGISQGETMHLLRITTNMRKEELRSGQLKTN